MPPEPRCSGVRAPCPPILVLGQARKGLGKASMAGGSPGDGQDPGVHEPRAALDPYVHCPCPEPWVVPAAALIHPPGSDSVACGGPSWPGAPTGCPHACCPPAAVPWVPAGALGECCPKLGSVAPCHAGAGGQVSPHSGGLVDPRRWRGRAVAAHVCQATAAVRCQAKSCKGGRGWAPQLGPGSAEPGGCGCSCCMSPPCACEVLSQAALSPSPWQGDPGSVGPPKAKCAAPF